MTPSITRKLKSRRGSWTYWEIEILEKQQLHHFTFALIRTWVWGFGFASKDLPRCDVFPILARVNHFLDDGPEFLLSSFPKSFLLILDINSSVEFSSSNFRQFVKFVPKDLQRLMQCFVWKKSKCVIKKSFQIRYYF